MAPQCPPSQFHPWSRGAGHTGQQVHQVPSHFPVPSWNEADVALSTRGAINTTGEPSVLLEGPVSGGEGEGGAE